MSLASSADITSASTGKDQDLTENTSVTSLVAELVNVKSASSSVEDVKVGTNACVPRGGFSSAESVANTSANGKVLFEDLLGRISLMNLS